MAKDPQQFPTDPLNVFSQIQKAGLDSWMEVSAAWMDALGEIGAEVASFVARRIKEDVETQHRMLHCKDAAELQHIQAEFFQKALEQYQAETGKLTEMSSTAIAKALEDMKQTRG